MRKFFQNLYKYRNYAAYSATASLREGVSGAYFSWLWWILDPLLFMLVYSFISLVVFGRSEEYFIPFVFIGLGTWNFIQRTISQSVGIVRHYKSILARVYLPKYILLFSNIFENFIQYLITLGLTAIMAVISGVPFSWMVFLLPVIIIVFLLLAFGVSCIMLHCGVYVRDLGNIVRVLLRLTFYLSGVFFSIPNRIPPPYSELLLAINPAAMLINESRNVLLYGKMLNWELVGAWFLIAIVLTAFGVYLIHRYEQNYTKR